jgi:deoxyribodipyrimidine photo-lyase
MWWASFWIHQQKLPWVLGAQHFMKHLIDADAASNTLSWRWVAGLQTLGKAYLVRRDNIERYHHAPAQEGIEMLENIVATIPISLSNQMVLPYQSFATTPAITPSACALLIHEEDLSVETTAMGHTNFHALISWTPIASEESSARSCWRTQAFADACERASQHFQLDCNELGDFDALIEKLLQHNIKQLLMMAPFVGPLRDAFNGLHERLSDHQIELIYLRREEDNRFFPYAKSGFFPFWKKASRHFTHA